MKFQRIAHVYKNNRVSQYQKHFAILPTPLLLTDRIRIFYASTDDDLNGRVFSVDVDRDRPTQIIKSNEEISLDIGRAGCFDQNGVNPLCLVDEGARLILYYAGYDRSKSVPYTLFSGIAASDNHGLTFYRLQEEPVLPPRNHERYFRTEIHVRRAGSKWQGWYIGGDKWTEHEGKVLPVYSLRFCESYDGLSWGPAHTILEPNLIEGEIGFGRPYVVTARAGGLGMFIIVRTIFGYKQGYMELQADHKWGPISYNVLSPTRNSWDSESTCYGAPVVVGDKEYLFYNGNGLGRTGFGVAVRDI